jgi:hypothetical protein
VALGIIFIIVTVLLPLLAAAHLLHGASATRVGIDSGLVRRPFVASFSAAVAAGSSGGRTCTPVVAVAAVVHLFVGSRRRGDLKITFPAREKGGMCLEEEQMGYITESAGSTTNGGVSGRPSKPSDGNSQKELRWRDFSCFGLPMFWITYARSSRMTLTFFHRLICALALGTVRHEVESEYGTNAIAKLSPPFFGETKGPNK